MNDEAKPVTWDDVLATYKKLADTPPPPKRYFISGVVWVAMLAKSSDDERAALEYLREREVIIVSEYIPDDQAYVFDGSAILP